MKQIEPSIPRIAQKKTAVKAKAKTKTETVTLKHLATALAESHDLKKAQANTVLMDMVAVITKHLKQGKRIKLNGLGILQVRKRQGAHGPQPGDGRSHQDQGLQEGRLPRRQGLEAVRLTATDEKTGASPSGGAFSLWCASLAGALRAPTVHVPVTAVRGLIPVILPR